MKKLTILLFFCLLSVSFLFAQDTAPQTTILTVSVSGNPVPQDKWNTLWMLPTDSLRLTFSATVFPQSSDTVLYKVLVGGKNPDLSSEGGKASSLIKNLPVGQHVISVQAYTNNGWEAQPASLDLNVTASDPQEGNTVLSEKKSELFQEPFFLLSAGLNVLLLILVIVLIFIKKKPVIQTVPATRQTGFSTPSFRKTTEKVPDSKTEPLAEDERYLFERMREELRGYKRENDFLKESVENLSQTVKELEQANVDLVQQKERLEQTKLQLEALQVQKDEYFAIAVHDLKNPAGAIRGLIELLESYDLNAQEQQEIMQTLVDSTNRIIKLAQDISTVVASTSMSGPLKRERANIRAVIDKVVNTNKAYANTKGIKLLNKASISTPDSYFDIHKLEEAIDNLVNNAIKFAPQGTVVQVKTFFSDTNITIEVADNGVGIPEGDLKRMFQKGNILSNKPTGGEHSTGLGLWSVKKIVEEHQGKVSVNSKVEVGSTFRIELPITTT